MGKVPAIFDYHYLLITYYKNLNISEDELVTLLIINNLILEGNELVTPEMVTFKSNYSNKQLDTIFVKLINKGLIGYESGVNMKTTIEPLKQKLVSAFKIEYENNRSFSIDENNSLQLENLHQEFGILLKRKLTPHEIETINKWIMYGYSPELIIDSLEKTLKNNNHSFSEIDKILLQISTSNDRKNEGVSGQTKIKRDDINKVLSKSKTLFED